ncbi:MAG: ATP-binding protein [Bacteroidota bacterium]
MPHRAPLSRSQRRWLHLVFVVALAMAAGYVVRLAMEPHMDAGFSVPSDHIIGAVAEGSAAEAAGVLVGDTLAADEHLRWRDGPTPETVRVLREGQVVSLALESRSPSLLQRVAMLPWYRWVLFGVGLVTLLIGWWVFTRNPDAPGTVPFVFWTALAMLVFPMIGPSRVWTLGMWQLHTGWEILFNGLYHAFTLHWLLRFPRPLGGRRTLWAVYGLVIGVMLWIAVGAFAPFRFPEAALHIRAAVVGLLVLGICGVQLARAPSRRTRRQASWILLAAATYAVLDIVFWEIPVLIGVNLGTTGMTNAIVGLSYLAIPMGIAVAVLREGLFGIDRFVTPGLATVATTIVLILAYVLGATALASVLGVPSDTLPMAAGIGLAAVLAVLVVPVQRRMYAALDRVFNRQERRHRAVIEDFEARVETTLDPAELRDALTASIQEGLDLTACTVEPAASRQLEDSRLVARPGVLDIEATAGVHLEEGLDAALRIPLPEASGVLRLGSRRSGARFTEDHVELVNELARRYTRAAERLALLRQIGERERELDHTRLRIAGDLHDDIGASLSSMAVMSDLVLRNETLSESDRRRLGRLSTSARDLVDHLRDIVWAIDPQADRVQDLVVRLRDTADALLPGVRCGVRAPEDATLSLDMDTRRHLMLVGKEALHNIARHARATEVRIELALDADTLSLSIVDNGQGFDPGQAAGGHGLKSLAERARQLNGTLEVTSAPGEGTQVTVRAPRSALTQNDANAP